MREKGKDDRFRLAGSIRVYNDKIRFPRIGCVRVKEKTKVQGRITSATIRKEANRERMDRGEAVKAKTVKMQYKTEHLKEGAICPFCGSADIEGDSVDIVGSSAMQDCSCSSCGKQWRDEYVLTYVHALK